MIVRRIALVGADYSSVLVRAVDKILGTHRPHRLTYRQAEYTFGLATAALGKDEPDGLPSPAL